MITDSFLTITYTGADGGMYSDTLHPSEVSNPPRQWLDAVQRIDILPAGAERPPDPITGDAARDYLKNLHTSNPNQ